MPDLWLPGALRVPGNNGLIAGAGGGKGKRFHTWHSFEAPYTFSPDCLAAARYLNSQGSTSTFCYHPITGAIAQLLPMNQAARTLRVKDPSTGKFADVNRHGDIHAQTEAIAYARRPFTLDLTEDGRRGLEKLVNFLRTWDIPDQWAWADQPPPVYPGGSVPRRWPEQSGHAYHAGWPVNNHGDPGAITAPWAIAGSPTGGTGSSGGTAQTGTGGFTTTHVRWVQSTLNAAGFAADVLGEPLDTDGSLGPLTTRVTKHAQTELGLDPDGLPGPLTTTALEEAMTKLDDILTEVRKLTTVKLNKSQRAALVTGRDTWDATDLLPTLVHRIGHTFQRVSANRERIDATEARVRGVEAAVKALAAQQSGVDVAELERVIGEATDKALGDLRIVRDTEE